MLTSDSQIKAVPFGQLDPVAHDAGTGDLFRSYAWLSVLARTYGYEATTLVDELSGCRLPIVPVGGLKGKRYVALPFSDYCAADPDDVPALIRIGGCLQSGSEQLTTTVKLNLPASPELCAAFGQSTHSSYLHRIYLDKAAGALTQSSQHRRAVRKARRAGLVVTLVRDQTAVERFYALHVALRRDKFSSLPQPLEFFTCIREEFMDKQRGFVLEAKLEGESIAALLVLRAGDTLYYKFGASQPSALPLRPNNLLFDHLIDYARANHIHTIDLGLSGSSEAYAGLVSFKEGLGGDRSYITAFSRKGAHTDAPVDGEWLGALTKELLDQPLSTEAASRLGGLLYPHFA